jgi:UDP-GlcNAc3NAcA epimerase
MKVMTVVGTRPEFIQTAPVCKALRRQYTEILVHTGQHYDADMSDQFFAELGLPTPEYYLDARSGSHAQQTAAIMTAIEPLVLDEKPDWVLVYGDTNSTIGAALVAAKLNIPIAHVEAGLRSFDRTMPEEVNRIITDHLSNMLFAPTQAAVKNLHNEGITQGIRTVGDVRVDVLTDLAASARQRSTDLRASVGLGADEAFAIATIHRPANTDDATRLGQIVESFNTLGLPVVLPAHPRLRKMLTTHDLAFSDNVRLIPPAGFLDMVAWMDAAAIVVTDSGGLQKEAYILKRPTVTVRDTTEWIETIEAGWNRLCEPVPSELRAAVADARTNIPTEHPPFYGEYGVGERISAALKEALG